MHKTAHITPAWWLGEPRRCLAKRGPAHLAAWTAICTGPFSHISGVGYLPVAEIAVLIGVTTDRAAKIVSEMEADGLLYFDRERSIGWLVGAIELQLGSSRWWANEKWLTSTINYLESLPISTAIDQFLAAYGLAAKIPHRYPIDRVSPPYPESPIGYRGVSPSPCSCSCSSLPPSAAHGAQNLPRQDANGLDLPGGAL